MSKMTNHLKENDYLWKMLKKGKVNLWEVHYHILIMQLIF